MNPEALQTPTVSLRHDVSFLPAHNEHAYNFKRALGRRIKSRQWPSTCDVHVIKLGRRVVTTTNVEKGEILVDYHGEEIKEMSCEGYLEIPGNQSEYLFQISQKHLVDASKEICDEHPNTWCLARLINHKSSKEASVEPVLVNIAQNKDVLVMVAKTDIAVFQELRFDYGDGEARRLFDP